jgi:hypothetical protein
MLGGDSRRKRAASSNLLVQRGALPAPSTRGEKIYPSAGDYIGKVGAGPCDELAVHPAPLSPLGANLLLPARAEYIAGYTYYPTCLRRTKDILVQWIYLDLADEL